MKGKRESLLKNIFILDMADEQGSFCSKLLADLGATVVKIESTKKHPSQRIGASRGAQSDVSRTSLSFFYHNMNKLGVALDLESRSGKRVLRSLIEKADVLVETFPRSRLEALGLDHVFWQNVNPRLIHLSITGFGRTGPKHTYLSCESVASAFGGQMYLTGDPLGMPIKLSGQQSCYTASLFGANAVLLALRRRKITERGCHVDLSIQESVASTLDHVMIDYFHEGKIAGRQDGYSGRNFSVLPCRDGFIQVTTLRNWETLLQLMESEGMANGLLEAKWRRKSYREKHARELRNVLSKWTHNHTRHELFELGQAMQFPWAPVCTLQEVIKSPQLKARRFFAPTAYRDVNSTFSVPGRPYKFRGSSPPPLAPAPLLGEHNSRVLARLRAGLKQDTEVEKKMPSVDSMKSGEILRGIRVLDLTRILSGPYATRILGDFGAEVIKVQSKRTAWGAEQNDTPYFQAWNRNKRSVCLNLEFPAARALFLDLTTVSDVVVENYSPRVMKNWNLDYSNLRRVKPDLIMASISTMGQTGPWKHFVGYGPTFHAFSGLLSATSGWRANPAILGHAYGDVIAGLYGALAILASLDHRDRTGKGQYIDLSAYEALCTLLGPALIEAASAGKRDNSSKLREDYGEAAPFGCYPCAGNDRWCVIAVDSERQWKSLCRISGKRELRANKFSTFANRRKNHSELERLIAQWTRNHAAGTLVHRLQRAGIAAGVVQDARDLAEDSQLAARHFFVSLEYPGLGRTYSDRSALWPWHETPMDWKPAPRLGEANRYVFRGLLGQSEEEFQSLIQKGIIQ
jgi:crotonobetainyl-CoA:carnitine CoA-transferase CaiB-like acyl-CoA transferase